MSTFKAFIEGKGITAKAISVASRRVEASGNEQRTMLAARAKKRRTQADKKYAELNLAKPASGRGVSVHQVEAAIAGKPLPRKIKSKLWRAVNAVLITKKQPKVDDHKLLFEGIASKAGKKPKEATAKK